MAAFTATEKATKRKLCLQVSPHSVSIEFQPNSMSLSASLPTLYLRMSRGSRATESDQAILQEGLQGSTTFKASWKRSTLPLNLALSQDAVSGKYLCKEIKFQLKIASEGKAAHKSLAGCLYDVTSLNLSALDYVTASSETRQVYLSTGKSAAATAAIRAITLEATFHYRFLPNDFDISMEQSLPRKVSPPKCSPATQGEIPPMPEAHSARIINMSQLPSTHTHSKPELQQHSGNIGNQHTQVEEVPDLPAKLKKKVKSRPEESGKLPQTPKKKFQWLRKVKSASRLNSTSGVMSTRVEQSQMTPQLESSCKFQDLSAALGGKNNVKETMQNETEDGVPPPKPERGKNRHKTENIIPEKILVQSESKLVVNNNIIQQEVLNKPTHVKPQPIVQQNLSASSKESTDERLRSFSFPSLPSKKGVMQSCSNRLSVLATRSGTEHTVDNLAREHNVVPKLYSTNSGSNSREFTKAKRLSKHISGSTPHLSPANIHHGKRSLSVSHLATNYQAIKGQKLSISDLIKPTVPATRSSNESHLDDPARHFDTHIVGILKVRLKAVDIPENCTNVSQINQTGAATDGLCCTFTMCGGNARFTSSVQPLVPDKTTTWNANEEMLFYATPNSKNMIILCRKTSLVPGTVSTVEDSKCIAAAILDISSVVIRSSFTDKVYDFLADIDCKDQKLPLPPKGTMLLQSCLYALQPRFQVSCTGRVTVESLSGVHCNADHDLSCALKIDSEFQDDTEPQNVQECAISGWSEEPLEFRACASFDCSIQIWAYSSEETEYWCGGCVVPLAMLLPDDVIRKHIAKQGQVTECVISININKTITMPVEPKGVITLSFSLEPSLRSQGHTPLIDKPKMEDISRHPAAHTQNPRLRPAPPAQCQQQVATVRPTKTGSLRRITMKKAGDFNLKVLKSYREEPLYPSKDAGNQENYLKEQTMDLKKEVAFLREELRQTKAKLAESEFYREKAQLELKDFQEQVQNVARRNKPQNKPQNKPKAK